MRVEGDEGREWGKEGRGEERGFFGSEGKGRYCFKGVRGRGLDGEKGE